MDSFQYIRASLPAKIRSEIEGFSCDGDSSGLSGASVYKLSHNDQTLYLKIEKEKNENIREHAVFQWLRDKLPVPEVIASCTENGVSYLLTTKAGGECACSEYHMKNPEQLSALLAAGIRALQSVNIDDCPFVNSLDYKLRTAKSRIKKGLVDMSDWNEDTMFQSPDKLYEYLAAHRPDETPCFTHGDYCLPNVFFENKNVSGFIDLGRAGIADIWQDIALCVRSMHFNFGTDKYDKVFFEHLGMKPDYQKIEYYILLDELF